MDKYFGWINFSTENFYFIQTDLSHYYDYAFCPAVTLICFGLGMILTLFSLGAFVGDGAKDGFTFIAIGVGIYLFLPMIIFVIMYGWELIILLIIIFIIRVGWSSEIKSYRAKRKAKHESSAEFYKKSLIG